MYMHLFMIYIHDMDRYGRWAPDAGLQLKIRKDVEPLEYDDQLFEHPSWNLVEGSQKWYLKKKVHFQRYERNCWKEQVMPEEGPGLLEPPLKLEPRRPARMA